jgi:hypothetical protein
MTLPGSFLALSNAGIRLANGAGRFQLCGPAGTITPEIKAGAAEHKATSLALLTPAPVVESRDPAEQLVALALEGRLAGGAANCGKAVALTGIGAYAEHLRPFPFRLVPRSLVAEGLTGADALAFSEHFGRIKTRITEREGGDADNRQSRGRLVQERGPLAVDRACDYVRQAALGLQHAFEQGMVHRDLKPHNLMLTPEGRVKILEFGLARFASEAASKAGVTGTGMALGTVDYIAPEQADSARQADIRSDIYSLGCTLYHLAAGQPPFPAGTALQKVMAHMEKTPQPLTELRPGRRRRPGCCRCG